MKDDPIKTLNDFIDSTPNNPMEAGLQRVGKIVRFVTSEFYGTAGEHVQAHMVACDLAAALILLCRHQPNMIGTPEELAHGFVTEIAKGLPFLVEVLKKFNLLARGNVFGFGPKGQGRA
jgi:hypothetical protein